MQIAGCQCDSDFTQNQLQYGNLRMKILSFVNKLCLGKMCCKDENKL